MRKVFLLFLFCVMMGESQAQNLRDSSITGTWEVKKLVWANPAREEEKYIPRVEDIFVGSTVSFEKNGNLVLDTKPTDAEMIKEVLSADGFSKINWIYDTARRVIKIHGVYKSGKKELLAEIEVMQKDGTTVFHPIETPIYFLVEKKFISGGTPK